VEVTPDPDVASATPVMSPPRSTPATTTCFSLIGSLLPRRWLQRRSRKRRTAWSSSYRPPYCDRRVCMGGLDHRTRACGVVMETGDERAPILSGSRAPPLPGIAAERSWTPPQLPCSGLAHGHLGHLNQRSHLLCI